MLLMSGWKFIQSHLKSHWGNPTYKKLQPKYGKK